MVRIVFVGEGGPESCPPESLAALRDCPVRFHADPSHPSSAWLAEMGLPCSELPSEGAPLGSVVAMPGLPRELAERRTDSKDRAAAVESLVLVVERLLGPGGCPWDREQTHESLKKHLLEEAYEVLEAIDSGSKDRLREELGDLLLQPLMHAEMSRVAGGFDIGDVAREMADKLVRRHPHVFGPLSVADAEEVLRNWDRIKQAEKDEPRSILDGVPNSLPSLHRAYEIGKRAARVGFEWPDAQSVFDKLREEELELREAMESSDASRLEEEIGDLLFTVVNLARWASVEPEEALRRMLNRFADRFRMMEELADKPLRDLSAAEWDSLWQSSKAALA